MKWIYDRLPLALPNPLAWWRSNTATQANAAYNNTGFTITAMAGDNPVTLSATTGLLPGMILRFDNAVTGETRIIQSIAGTSVTLVGGGVANTYAAAAVYLACAPQLTDLSGNGHTQLQATGAKQPALINSFINGYMGLKFDGVDDEMNATFAIQQGFTVFSLANSTPNGNGFITGTVASANYYQRLANGPNRYTLNAGVSLQTSAIGPAGAQTRLFTGVANSVANSNNSLCQVNQLATTTGNAGAGNPDGITLANITKNAVASNNNMYFIETRIYPRALNVRQIRAVQQQMLQYYAL